MDTDSPNHAQMTRTPSKRKRGLFSCDRCKIKKIACSRSENELSTSTPCDICQALQIECKTTIKRKKRKMDKEINGKCYQECVSRILQTIFPDFDVNSISSLLQLEKTLKTHPLKLKELVGSSLSSSEQSSNTKVEQNEHLVISSGKMIKGIDITTASFGSQNNYDRVIYDNEGISHYMGPFGFSNFLTLLLKNMILTTKQKDFSSIRLIRNMNEHGSIISSFTETIEPSFFQSISTLKFPCVSYYTRDEANYYVDVFFQHLNPLLIGIDRVKFESYYEVFWDILEGTKPISSISNVQICCIYVIWIIGVTIELYPQAVMQETYELVNRYINLIKLILSDILLMPTSDGIVCLLLLSIFFERNMQLETAYVLCETAVRHATSCGFHREAISNEETFKIWWSLFHKEIELCLYLGRPSTISLTQVNLDCDKHFLRINNHHSEIEYFLTKLDKIAYNFLKSAAKLPTGCGNVSEVNIATAFKTFRNLTSYYDSLPEKLKTETLTDSAEVQLMMNYHLLSMCSTLPFILRSLEMNAIQKDLKNIILPLVNRCLDSAINFVKIIDSVKDQPFFNCLEFDEACTSCYSMLAFVVSFLFFHKHSQRLGNESKNIDPENSFESKLVKAMQESSKLGTLNQARLNKARGTLRVRRFWVETLNEDLEILKAYFNSSGQNETAYFDRINKKKLGFSILNDIKNSRDIVTISRSTEKSFAPNGTVASSDSESFKNFKEQFNQFKPLTNILDGGSSESCFIRENLNLNLDIFLEDVGLEF